MLRNVRRCIKLQLTLQPVGGEDDLEWRSFDSPNQGAVTVRPLRRDLFGSETIGIYHCFSRIVRCRFRCGFDPLTRKDSACYCVGY